MNTITESTLLCCIYQALWLNENLLQKQYEYEADEEALKACGNKDDIIDALKNISIKANTKFKNSIIGKLIENTLNENIKNKLLFILNLTSTHPTNEQREQHLIEQIQNGLLTQNN